MKKKLDKIVEYLNKRFYQGSQEYNFIHGPKPQVIRYDQDSAISIWACGAIVCIKDVIYFIEEDDGYWWYNESETNYGFQGNFSIGWIESFTKALKDLKDFVDKNGVPVRHSFSDGTYGDICHYKLE